MRTLADIYQEYVVELDPVLWQMGRCNGIPVDNDARLDLLSKMNTEVKGYKHDAQPFVPTSLFPTKHYKTRPETDRPLVAVEIPSDAVKTCSNCGAQHVSKGGHTARKGGKGDTPLNLCYKAAIELRPGINTEYDKQLEFNPGSIDQLKTYAEYHRHKLGWNRDTQQANLDAKQLQKMINWYGIEHPIYAIAKRLALVKKARGTVKSWEPDEKGLLYGQFKNSPETLRLAQAKHNFMNVSHRTEAAYAEEIRRLIVARPGYLLVEADSSAVEAVMTGKEMGSPGYMAMAKKGVHAVWACKVLGLDPTDANIKLVKRSDDPLVKKTYARKKRTVHGVSYGMRSGLLAATYPEDFPPVWRNLSTGDILSGAQFIELGERPKGWKLDVEYNAQREIDDFYAFAPELHAFHLDVQKTAHKQGFLTNAWGLRNYYYRVFQYDFVKKEWKNGPDANAVIAFKPQSHNGMFQRKNLIMMANRGWLKYMPATGHCHDSNGLHIPEDKLDAAIEMFGEVMNRPIPELGGLQIGLEVKVGTNWADMKAVRAWS